MSYIAERFFGVADITGAYIAGIVLSMTEKEPYLSCRFNTLSYLYLSPIFFASIGLKVVLPEMSGAIIAFAVILTVVAMLTKLIGCGLGAKICHYTNKEAVQIGIGMISRGEVALIIASKGASLGLMPSSLMGPVIIMVVITTTVTPILLKPVFKDKDK
jgi:Kef-type K+ transport system membrane component KefB